MGFDGSLNFDTNVSTKGFIKGISGLKSKLNGVKSAFSELSAVITATFSAAAIVGFGKNMIESAAEINASNSQMEQTFGNLYSSAEDAMRRVAETSGIVQSRLQGVGTSIYAFAKTSGMDSATALNMMEEALQVTADSAAYYDRSLEETSESLQSFLKGNFENDAALGLSCTETTRNTAANRLYGKSFQQLSESQKQLTLLQMVKDANALSGALGQAPREADGWENVIGNLKEAWKQFMAVIGQPVLNVAVSAVKQLTDALTFLTEKARSVLGVFSELFGFENNDSEEVSMNISENISESVNEQNDLTEAVEETTETQKKSLAGFDEINTLSEQKTENSEKQANKSEEVPVTPTVVTNDSETKKKVDGLSDKIQKLIKPIQLAWEANSPELIENFRTACENIKGLVKNIAESFEEVWTNGSGEQYIGNIIILFADIFGIIGDIAGALRSAWEDDGRGTALIQSYFDRWNALFELIHAINSAFREAWNDGTGEKICANIFEIITNINNTVTNLRQRFTEAWNENGVGVRIFGAILGIINIVLEVINKITEKTAEWAKKLDFSPFLESVAGFFESLEPLVKNVGDIFSGIYEKILLPLGKWTIEKVVPASIDLFSGAIELLNSVIEVFKPFGKWLYDNFLKPIGEWTGGVIISVIKGLSGALKGISDWISEHQTLVQDFLIIIGSIGTALAISGIIIQAVDAFQKLGGIITIITGLFGGLSGIFSGVWAFLTNPITLVCLAIGAVIAIGILLVKHWDEVKAVAIGMWESIQETLYDFFEAWEIGFDTIVEFSAEIWNKITLFFAEAWEIIVSIFQNIGGWFSDLWNDIVSIFVGIGEWFGEKFSQAWNSITGIFGSIGSWFSDRWNDITEALSDIIKWFKNTFKKVYTEITDNFKNIGKWFREKFTQARNNITEIFQNIGSWFYQRWNDIVNVFSGIGAWFWEKFLFAWDNITTIFKGIGGWFYDRWNEIVNVFSGVGLWFWDRFLFAWDNITTIFKGIGSWFSDRWNDIVNIFSGVGDWFSEKFQNAWNGIKNAFSEIHGFFEGVWNSITNVFSHVTDWFRDTFSRAWEAVRNVFSRGGEIFTGITDGIFDTFRNIVNGLIDGINWVIEQPFNAINWALDGIRYIEILDWYPFEWLPSIDVPQIPYLAQGTVVPANYGNFLAVLGDNKRETEVVSPLSTIEQAVTNAMRKNSTGNGEIHIHVDLDGREIGRVAVRAVNQDRLRRGG
ncbi:MAG: hypothetical protein K2K16_12650 [Ruminococcus sp.]|nr:hypothetical protein [Ruminococcus sp.]